MAWRALLFFILPVALGAYVPGTPGAPWTEEQAEIIRSKLYMLGKKAGKLMKDVDPKLSKSGNDKYLYDPDLTTVNPDYEKCVSDAACDERFEDKKRINMLKFSARKALRLAFHDCVGYADDPQGSGCDGCLNFDENRMENQGLQHTAAVLERLYTDVNYPKMPKKAPKLTASPYDLGMSRADLWAFAGLVALDYFQSETEELCTEKDFAAMCGNWTTSCFSPFPEDGRTLFKTGRADCTPRANAGPFQGYVASRVENQPVFNGNYDTTMEFFDTAIGLNGREALALMGAHTVSEYNTVVVSDNAYNWLRRTQNKLFNNKYYKVMAQRTAKVYDECTGTMSDEEAPSKWTARTNILKDTLKVPDPWATADNPGHLRWNLFYMRGPTCQKGTFGYEHDKKLWNKRKNLKAPAAAAGFSTPLEFCCNERERNCADDDSCFEDCTIPTENKERYLGPDMGFYFKWDLSDDGLPRGCPGFVNKKTGEDMTDEDFQKKGMVIPDCPMQDTDDGTGQEMWETVEEYADSNEAWIAEFVIAFDILQNNGYDNLEQGPQGFWTHF